MKVTTKKEIEETIEIILCVIQDIVEKEIRSLCNQILENKIILKRPKIIKEIQNFFNVLCKWSKCIERKTKINNLESKEYQLNHKAIEMQIKSELFNCLKELKRQSLSSINYSLISFETRTDENKENNIIKCSMMEAIKLLEKTLSTIEKIELSLMFEINNYLNNPEIDAEMPLIPLLWLEAFPIKDEDFYLYEFSYNYKDKLTSLNIGIHKQYNNIFRLKKGNKIKYFIALNLISQINIVDSNQYGEIVGEKTSNEDIRILLAFIKASKLNLAEDELIKTDKVQILKLEKI